MNAFGVLSLITYSIQIASTVLLWSITAVLHVFHAFFPLSLFFPSLKMFQEVFLCQYESHADLQSLLSIAFIFVSHSMRAVQQDMTIGM